MLVGDTEAHPLVLAQLLEQPLRHRLPLGGLLPQRGGPRRVHGVLSQRHRVPGLRQTALVITMQWRVFVTVLTVGPAILINSFALSGLTNNGQYVLPVLIPLWIQLGLAEAAFAGALLNPERNQIG